MRDDFVLFLVSIGGFVALLACVHAVRKPGIVRFFRKHRHLLHAIVSFGLGLASLIGVITWFGTGRGIVHAGIGLFAWIVFGAVVLRMIRASGELTESRSVEEGERRSMADGGV